MTEKDLRSEFQRVISQTIDGKALFKMDLRDRMAAMAEVGRALILHGIENIFLAAVITASDIVFPANVITDDHHKEAIRKGLIELAGNVNALCVIIVMEAWGVKATAENFQPHLRHSEHPNRQEFLVVDAKDYFEHLAGMQFIRRSGDRVDFSDLQIETSPRSWLDEWQVNVPTTTVC